MHKHAGTPGICEEALLQHANRYERFKKEQLSEGKHLPLGEGVLTFDETKVTSHKPMQK